jgi:uncharacterized protein YdcH (DUF465 family)
MCTAEAGFALKVVGAVAEHNAKKEKAYRTSVSNFHAKNAASAALFDDYGTIDNNRINAAKEKAAEKFNIKREKIANLSKQLNLNVGNATAIYKDVGTDTDKEFRDVDMAFTKDMMSFNRQENEAYASYANTINNLPVPVQPSDMALAINIASAGTDYAGNEDRKFFTG